MEDKSIQLRIVYEDLPDLIELGVMVRYSGWQAFSKAYTSPDGLADQARALIAWAAAPSPLQPVRIEAGADTGIGWLVLTFYTIDPAGHARCAVKLATGGSDTSSARPEETWRLAIEIETEIGLIERFAQECLRLSTDHSAEARLAGLPT